MISMISGRANPPVQTGVDEMVSKALRRIAATRVVSGGARRVARVAQRLQDIASDPPQPQEAVAVAPEPPRREESILLNTMPKSGSIYAARSLQKIVGLDFIYLGNGYNLIDQIALTAARKFRGGGYISQNHFAPSAENLQILEHFKLKMVLHLRDPRQALLSWIYHLDQITDGNDDSEFLLYFTPRTPPGYFGSSLSRKIDWQIENSLPDVVAWTKRWLEIVDRGRIPILITHQNDLRTNEKAFFDSILAFYQIDCDYVPPDLPKTEETHFRRADPEEWRRTFTAEQVAVATSRFPMNCKRGLAGNDGCRRVAAGIIRLVLGRCRASFLFELLMSGPDR
jgi:hypothetical protein